MIWLNETFLKIQRHLYGNMATKGLRQNKYNSVLAIDIGIYTRSEMLAKTLSIRQTLYMLVYCLSRQAKHLTWISNLMIRKTVLLCLLT